MRLLGREFAMKANYKQVRRAILPHNQADAWTTDAAGEGGCLTSLGSLFCDVAQRPGPDTNVRTSVSGTLFKDVVLWRVRTMAPAGGGLTPQPLSDRT